MKRLFMTLIAVLCFSVSAQAAIIVQTETGSTSSIYTSLSQVVGLSNIKKVTVTSALSASFSNISSATVHEWPADKKLVVEKGGSIGNTTTFKIAGPFEAGLHQAFSGTGAVTFVQGSVSLVYPEWWGAKADYDRVNGIAHTDSLAAIQSAINTLIPVFFSPGNYYVSGTLYIPTPPKSMRLIGNNTMYSASGVSSTPGTTQIFSDSTSVFKTTIPGSGSGALPSAQVFMEGLAWYPLKAGSSFLDTVDLTGASKVEHCFFQSFLHVVYGAITGLTEFSHNIVAAASGSAIVVPAGYSTVSVDSSVSYNYFNGDHSLNTVTLLACANWGSMSITHNYFDYALVGIDSGGANGMVVISDNIFDILVTAIKVGYGGADTLITKNTFMRIAKTSASYFTAPTADMQNLSWNCIAMGENIYNKIITNNMYTDADRFIYFDNRGAKNITEANNWGTNAAVVYNRTSDFTTYSGDGTNLYFGSWDRKPLTAVPHRYKGTYEGHQFSFYNTLVTTRSNWLLDALGGKLLGRTNLLSATDFTGWTAGTGVTISGGVLTSTTGNGWQPNLTLPSPVAAGTYLVCVNAPSYTSGYVDVRIGTTMSSSQSLPGGGGGTGPFYFVVTITGSQTTMGIYLGSFVGSLDYVTLVKLN